MDKLKTFFNSVHLGSQYIKVFEDVFEVGPWSSPQKKEEALGAVLKILETMRQKSGDAKTKEFLELSAERTRSAVVGDSASHRKAIDGIKNLFGGASQEV